MKEENAIAKKAITFVFKDAMTSEPLIDALEVTRVKVTLTWEEFQHIKSVSETMALMDSRATVLIPCAGLEAFDSEDADVAPVSLINESIELCPLLSGENEAVSERLLARRITFSACEKHGVGFDVGNDSWLTINDLEQVFLTGDISGEHPSISLLNEA